MEAVRIDKKAFHFDALYAVARARSDDPTRGSLQSVHVEKGTVVASDGRRLHACWNVPPWHLQPGEYDVVKASKSEIVLALKVDPPAFPPWAKMFRHGPVVLEVDTGRNGREAMVARVIKDVATVNYQFLLDLPADSYRVSHDGSGPVAFRSADYGGHFRALIMPMDLR